MNQIENVAALGKSSVAAIVGLAILATTPVASLGQEILRGIDLGLPQEVHPDSDTAMRTFVSRLDEPDAQDLHTAPLGPVSALSLPFPIALVNLEVSSFASLGSSLLDSPTSGGHQVSDTRYLQVGAAGGQGDFLRFDFDPPQEAVGFYATDASDYAGVTGSIPPIVVEIVGVSNSTELDLTGAIDVTSIPNGSTLFLGILWPENPILSLAFRNPAGTNDDGIGFDDIIVGEVDLGDDCDDDADSDSDTDSASD